MGCGAPPPGSLFHTDPSSLAQERPVSSVATPMVAPLGVAPNDARCAPVGHGAGPTPGPLPVPDAPAPLDDMVPAGIPDEVPPTAPEAWSSVTTLLHPETNAAPI